MSTWQGRAMSVSSVLLAILILTAFTLAIRPQNPYANPHVQSLEASGVNPYNESPTPYHP